MALERLLHTTAGLLAITLCACGGGDAKRTSDATMDSAASTAAGEDTAAAPTADPGQAPLTVADIDRWERGMAAELAAVQTAAAKVKEARTGEDSLKAMMGVQEMTTAEAGAKAAGVGVERYNLIRSNLSSAASYLAPWIGGVDTTTLTPEMRAEMKQGNAAALEQMKGIVPADVVAALTPRAPELRKKDMELAMARLKGVGA